MKDSRVCTNHVLHSHNGRCRMRQIASFQRDTWIGDFSLWFVYHFSLFIESVRESDVYRRQSSGKLCLHFLHQHFTTRTGENVGISNSPAGKAARSFQCWARLLVIVDQQNARCVRPACAVPDDQAILSE